MVSIVTYTGDGSTTDYSIPFPYLDREHVVVELDDLVTTNFSFLSDTSIRLSSAPVAQTRIVVKRSTPVAPLVDFTDGSTLFEADLDLADQQSRYLGEEARDRSDSALTTINNNLADVNTVADIASDVSTVAAVDDDVTTVATNLNGTDTIGTVAGIDTEVTTVAGIATDVTTVSANDSNVTTTATNIANVNTVAGINTDVTTVSGISGDVTTVANNDANVTTVASNDANITTVAGISSDVTTVANNDANVTAVAGNASDISTVAGINTAVSSVATNNANVTTAATNIANVNTVAGNITNVNNVGAIDGDVTIVAGISGNVSTVAGISTDVSTVATNNTNVTAVGGSIANVNTAAGSINNINTVASDIINVNTAATDIANINTAATSIAAINTVATAVTDVSTVSSDIASVITAANDLNEAVSEIETVAASITNVDTVGAAIANVNTVAGISSDVSTVSANDINVTTVAGIDANITTVAGISGNVTTVAGISSDVTTVANDETNIGTVATNISNVNAVGGSISNVNTVATNINNVNDFFDVYRVGTTDPTTSLGTGDLFYNTTSGTLKVYTGSGWEQGVTAGSGFLPLTGGTLTGNLVFSGTETVDGRDLSVDGAKLDGIEAGADVTDAANVEPLVDAHINVSGASSGQYLGWNGSDYAWSTVDLTTKVSKSGDTMTGALILNADPTAALGASTKQYVDTQVAGIVDSAPATLDTLNELAAALGDDPNFATTVSNSIGTKLNASDYTAADVLTKIKTVDGSGSGLDADTVDGIQGSSIVQTSDSRLTNSRQCNNSFDNPTTARNNLGLGTTNGPTFASVTISGGATLRDTGQGYGTYGGLCVAGGGLNGWDGVSISDRVVFMHNGGTEAGIYDDVNNKWMWRGNLNGSSEMFYGGTSRISTNSSGGYTNGTHTATNFNTTSDATLKTNVETLTGSLDAVKAMRGVSFDWIENGNSEVGVIAQEVEEVIPDLVSTNDQGIKSVKYGNIVAVLIEAIKEQQEQIDALKEQLNS